MKELNPLAASGRIQDALEARGWRLATPFPKQLVRVILKAGGVPNPEQLAGAVPGAFLAANNISRTEVQDVLARALAGYRIVDTLPQMTQVTNNYYAKVEQVAKKNEINTGQWIGNNDSPNSTTNVERQQQVQMTSADEQALQAHVKDPAIQEALALPLPQHEKAQIVGGRLATVAKVAVDVGVDFAAKLIAEMVRPH